MTRHSSTRPIEAPSRSLRSGELAAAAGVNLQTLRYYERRGLLAEPERSPGGHRLYPAEVVALLQAVKTVQRLGFTLAEVADLLDARTPPSQTTDSGLQERVRSKLSEVERRIADLDFIRATLRQAIDVGCSDLLACADEPRCPLPFADPAHVRDQSS
ncbi:MerR family transcriptional regulator [Actinomadura harenae]|uniref:MerR family transcriptional regulator n=1 Tax=Actinomadura harenae TaxID=2483351 RepID=A0A3M2LZ28_9ACTN|nr:MerR family transcriptional regulator [Actinomadura harenae]RMI42436.1 MerR family transcriptional regulator [Actinomadura harenae]